MPRACYLVHGTNFVVSKRLVVKEEVMARWRYSVLEQVGQGAYGIVCAAQATAVESLHMSSFSGVRMKRRKRAWP